MVKQSNIRNLLVAAELTPKRTSLSNLTQLIVETEGGWVIGLARLEAEETLSPEAGSDNAEEIGTLCEEGQEEWEIDLFLMGDLY
jgi:hypothetical protein